MSVTEKGNISRGVSISTFQFTRFRSHISVAKVPLAGLYPPPPHPPHPTPTYLLQERVPSPGNLREEIATSELGEVSIPLNTARGLRRRVQGGRKGGRDRSEKGSRRPD
jgi:hypothetical protein